MTYAKYPVDHQNFSFTPKFNGHLKNLRDPYIIKLIDIKYLYGSILTKTNPVKHKFVRLSQTPHFYYLNGIKDHYSKYLQDGGIKVGFGVNHTTKNFDKLIDSFGTYLKKPHESDYIVVEQVKTSFGNRLVIVDGLHRAVILLKQKYTKIPVVQINFTNTNQSQINQYCEDYKDDFLEWYTPIQIGGCTIHERTYPSYKIRPEYLNNQERGLSKWDYIIKKNLPDLKGKTIYDIGCNNGLFSILLKEYGAQKVYGIDRSNQIIQPTNPNLPKQSNVQQAYFVKNLFKLAGYPGLDNITYKEKDIDKLDFSTLKCDLLYATCILYHFGKIRFEQIIEQSSQNIPEIFLQTNLGHQGGELGELASVGYQVNLLRKYGYKVRSDVPPSYNYPVIYGRK